MAERPDPKAAETHPFVARPHRTFAVLSAPVLASLIAEPLTGIVDTAFVARLGATPLAALGAATVLLSRLFWIFILPIPLQILPPITTFSNQFY